MEDLINNHEFQVLTHLRQQRMLMVQTVAQYKFVHTVLINYLGQSRLI